MIFVIFIRYSCFAFNDDSNTVDYGRWPVALNAIFNGLAHYLYLLSVVGIFIPVFLGKLSIIRDIYASAFFRPLARVNLTTSMI